MLTPEQIADGWIEHDGGPCPVPLDSRPRILFKVGEPYGSGRVRATCWVWGGYGRAAIIAYRPEPRHD